MSVTTTILQVLHGVGGHRLNRTVLLAEVRIRANGCGESDFHTALQNLSTAKMITSEEDGLTGDTYFLITPLGEARIRGGK